VSSPSGVISLGAAEILGYKEVRHSPLIWKIPLEMCI